MPKHGTQAQPALLATSWAKAPPAKSSASHSRAQPCPLAVPEDHPHTRYPAAFFLGWKYSSLSFCPVGLQGAASLCRSLGYTPVSRALGGLPTDWTRFPSGADLGHWLHVGPPPGCEWVGLGTWCLSPVPPQPPAHFLFRDHYRTVTSSETLAAKAVMHHKSTGTEQFR